MRRVETIRAAIDLMELHCPVDPLPKIQVLNGHHLPESFPPPIVPAPFPEAIADALADIGASGDQSHPRGLVKRLQPADYCEKLKPFPPNFRLDVVGLEPERAVGRSQDKPPAAGLLISAEIGEQQIVR